MYAECNTALMVAAKKDNAQSMIALLSSVKNTIQFINMKNQNDYTALMLAAINSQTKSIQALLENEKILQEIIYFSNNNGTTALMLSAKYDQNKNIKSNGVYLMLTKAKKIRDPEYLIYLKDSNGMNAFMYAAENNNFAAIQGLFNLTKSKLALFNQRNNNQRTILDLLGAEKFNALIEYLEKGNMLRNPYDIEDTGDSVDSDDSDGFDAMGDVEDIKTLLSQLKKQNVLLGETHRNN